MKFWGRSGLIREAGSTAVLSERDQATLLAIARALMPAGDVLPLPGSATLERFQSHFARMPPALRTALRALWWTIELAPLTTAGRTFTSLPEEGARSVLQEWHTGSPARRWALRSLFAPLKLAHFDDPALFQALGVPYALPPVANVERPRWMGQLQRLSDLEKPETLECDVVVVGTGAGGAVAAKELAELGLVVVMLEEGGYFDRRHFRGRALSAMLEMYRSGGLATTIGSPPIVIPSGRTVGGSTTVNSGTCFRAPDRVLYGWEHEHGLSDLSPGALAPYFERVERILQVEAARDTDLGGCGRVVARGCEALGLERHGPLHRNAPACDGQGYCCFGCPTDAKRSTNVSYVPMALRQGALLFSGARVERITVENGRAVGVTAVDARGSGQELKVRARAVVISCGAYLTPVLLQRNGLGQGSGQLGRNLSLHPAAAVMATFQERVEGWRGIPQGYHIGDFEDRGVRFEGGFTPLELTAAALDLIGPDLTRTLERFAHLACFGVMVEDSSRGRVRAGPKGHPVVTYNLNRQDLTRLTWAVGLLAELYFAAGAERVFTGVSGFEILSTRDDVARLRRADLKPMDLALSAYHPLGTARLGHDPRTSVVDVHHQVHGVPGLYVMDGSSVPTSLGVNPQVTIMAMATRAAQLLAEQLS